MSSDQPDDAAAIAGSVTGPATSPTAGEVAGLRALAHPTRTRILALLRDRASMTATECAGILHLTPKTCSYHLLTLASSGLIEEVPSEGRNRPWRLVPSAAPDAGTPAPAAVLDNRRSVLLRREESLLNAAAAAIAAAAPGWADAVTVHTRVASMTVDELRAWCDDVERVTSRHVRKASVPPSTGDTDERVPVHLLFCGFPAE